MSRIEQIITEIEDYIGGCKSQMLNSSNIIVNKEEMEQLLVELRMQIPEETKKSQKIISNQDHIIAEAKDEAAKVVRDAKSEADTLIAKAEERTSEMVSQHEIMQRAYEQADQVVREARQTAQEIVDAAAAQANELRSNSMRYTDEMLGGLQTIIRHSLDDAESRFESFRGSLQSSYDIVTGNRDELSRSLQEAGEDSPR